MIEILVFSLIIFIFGIIPSFIYLKNYSKLEQIEQERNKKPIKKNVIYFTIIIFMANIGYLSYLNFEELKNYFIILVLAFALIGVIWKLKDLIYFLLVFNLIYLYFNIKDFLQI